MKLKRKQQICIISGLLILIFIVIFYLTDQPHKDQDAEIPLDETMYNTNISTLTSQKLLNITLKYILNSEDNCNSSEEILAVFIVTSYFGNVETRSSMRRAFDTDALKKLNLRRIFLLGEAPNDKYTSQQSVNDESRRFGDILQGNFLEAYRNLTYKHVMGLKWAGTYCSNAKYIIKMDDDTVVNMYALKSILDSLEIIHHRDFIAGYKLRKMKPIREPANKWFVTRQEYSASNYPIFVSGWFYITNPQAARKLAAWANFEKYFWIDDVFVTGILAKKLKILLFDISKYFMVNAEFLQCCLQDFDKNIDCGEVYLGPNGGDSNMFFKFNEKARKCYLEHTCSKREKPLNETCVAERKINFGKRDSVISDFKLI